MSNLIQPLQPAESFVDKDGRLLWNAYDFLNRLYLRVGGSLDSLNAATLQTFTWQVPGTIGSTTPNTGKFTTLNTSGQYTNTLAIGTAPMVITSTTRVANLNVATCGNADTVTTNANLTGPITSVGNATTIAASPTITTPTLTSPTINTSVLQGSGMKHQRVTTGSIAGGANALVTLTWTSAFADANYTAVAEVLDATAAVASLQVIHIEAIAAASVKVRINNTAAGALTGTLQVIAMHD